MPEETPTPASEHRLNVFALPNQTTILVVMLIVVLFGTLVAISINAPFAVFWPLTVALLALSLRGLLAWPEHAVGRRYIRPPDARFAPLQRHIDELALQIGLRRAPALLVIPSAGDPEAIGALRRRYIVLSETMSTRVLDELHDPAHAIDADWVLLHELSHFHHGDMLQTGYARALLRTGASLVGWAALFLLGLTLLLILSIDDLLGHNPKDLARQFDAVLPGLGMYDMIVALLPSSAAWEETRQRAATINLGLVSLFSFLNTFPVALLSAVLLGAFWFKIHRLRELYADAGAAQALGTSEPLGQAERLRSKSFTLDSGPEPGRLRHWLMTVANEAQAFWFNLREVPGISWIWGWVQRLLRKHYPLTRRRETLIDPRLLYDSQRHGWRRPAWIIGALVVTLELLLTGTSALFFIGAWPMHPLVIVSTALLGLELMIRAAIDRPTYRSILATVVIVLVPHTVMLLISLALLWLLLLVAPAFLTGFLNAAAAAIAGFAGFLTESQIGDSADLVGQATFINLSQIPAMYVLITGALLLWLVAVRRTLRWYALLRSARDWKRIVYSLLLLVILVLAFGVLPPITDLVTWQFARVLSRVPGLIGTTLVAATVAAWFWWIDRRYADRCPHCGEVVVGDYHLGATCPHCGELLHPWLFATYRAGTLNSERNVPLAYSGEIKARSTGDDAPEPKTT